MKNLVVFDISLSLDGFIRGPNPRSGNVLGDGGEELHAWARDHATDADRRLLEDSIHGAGAVICGRRTYDDSLSSWQADGPTGPARLPVFVVTHSTSSTSPEGGVYKFREDIESAINGAKAAAAGKDVCIMGGADIGQQFIRAGLVDELSLHIVPILLGGGKRLFECGTEKCLKLKAKSVTNSPRATHIRYALAQ